MDTRQSLRKGTSKCEIELKVSRCFSVALASLVPGEKSGAFVVSFCCFCRVAMLAMVVFRVVATQDQ